MNLTRRKFFGLAALVLFLPWRKIAEESVREPSYLSEFHGGTKIQIPFVFDIPAGAIVTGIKFDPKVYAMSVALVCDPEETKHG